MITNIIESVPSEDSQAQINLLEKIDRTQEKYNRILVRLMEADKEVNDLKSQYIFDKWNVKIGSLVRLTGSKRYIVSEMILDDEAGAQWKNKPYLKGGLIKKDGLVSDKKTNLWDSWSVISSDPNEIMILLTDARESYLASEAKGGTIKTDPPVDLPSGPVKYCRGSNGPGPQKMGFFCSCSCHIAFADIVFRNWNSVFIVTCPKCETQYRACAGIIQRVAAIPAIPGVATPEADQPTQP